MSLYSLDFLKCAKNYFCLSENFGARNLAGNKDERMEHWDRFLNYVNNLELNLENENSVIEGTLNAYRYYFNDLNEFGNTKN